MYLGSSISNAPVHKQVGEQMSLKQCHARKFCSFLRKNSEAPFAVKRAIWESALISSILYGCETWMTNSLKTVEQLYQHTLKDLIGVRYQTPSDLVYVETGIPPLPAFVAHRQRSFLEKLQASPHFTVSPVQKAHDLAREYESPMNTYMQNLWISLQLSSPTAALSEVKARIKLVTTSRALTHKVINPSLEVQPVYARKSKHTSEPYRIAFSRFRLDAHGLRVDTGRWSHIMRDMRVCRCGPFVQDEDHVIRKCSLTRDVSRFAE